MTAQAEAPHAALAAQPSTGAVNSLNEKPRLNERNIHRDPPRRGSARFARVNSYCTISLNAAIHELIWENYESSRNRNGGDDEPCFLS